jgi:hypothetical protein
LPSILLIWNKHNPKPYNLFLPICDLNSYCPSFSAKNLNPNLDVGSMVSYATGAFVLPTYET